MIPWPSHHSLCWTTFWYWLVQVSQSCTTWHWLVQFNQSCTTFWYWLVQFSQSCTTFWYWLVQFSQSHTAFWYWLVQFSESCTTFRYRLIQLSLWYTPSVTDSLVWPVVCAEWPLRITNYLARARYGLRSWRYWGTARSDRCLGEVQHCWGFHALPVIHNIMTYSTTETRQPEACNYYCLSAMELCPEFVCPSVSVQVGRRCAGVTYADQLACAYRNYHDSNFGFIFMKPCY